jgi:hypothetical protein
MESRTSSASSRLGERPPYEAIFRIGFTMSLRNVRAQSIGVGKDNRSDEFLQRPAIVDELSCEVIEQFRV